MQRFGDALNLDVHFHALVLDGAYALRPAAPRASICSPDDTEVARVAAALARRLALLPAALTSGDARRKRAA